MFIDPAQTLRPPPLAHSPFKALVVPRPIGWISTRGRNGAVNLAPYSFFNAISEDPPCVLFCAGGQHRDGGLKDSLKNAEETGEFVYNLVTADLAQAMNRTAAHEPRDVDEMALAGLTAAPSRNVKPPRVAESPASFECRTLQIVVPDHPRARGRVAIVLGEVVGIHLRDDVIVDGRVDIGRLRPLARLGDNDYTVVERAFPMARPD